MNYHAILAFLGTNLIWSAGIMNNRMTNGQYAEPICMFFAGIGMLALVASVFDVGEKGK